MLKSLDSRLRGNDKTWTRLTFYETVIYECYSFMTSYGTVCSIRLKKRGKLIYVKINDYVYWRFAGTT